MNKHAIITGVAIAVIVVPFAYSAMSIIGVQQMEYRWNGPGMFSFFAMSNHGELEFCNTMPFWISFQSMEVGSYYGTEHMGSFFVKPLTIDPIASAVQEGTFKSDQLAAVQHNFMTLDFEFDGGDIRLDPNQFIIVIKTDTPILGLIPYSSTTQITGFDFDQMMNVEDLTCN